MRVSVLIAAAYLTTACYNFRPLETPSPDAGAYVAATLSDSGSVELARYLGPDVFVVRGRYLGSGADERGLAVSVAEVETKRGDEVSWRGETITLPVDAIDAPDDSLATDPRISVPGLLLVGGCGHLHERATTPARD